MHDFIDKHAPDIFLIQETHLRPEHSFKIPNYSCYRNDRNHAAPGWGGTALLFKNCISHYHVPTPPQSTGVEMTLIMLTPIDHEPILIGSTYIPPHKTELNRIQNKIKRKVGLYRQQVWEDHLTSLDAEDGSLWGTARAFRKKASPIFALNGPNGVALSDTNKTELIALSFENQFQLNDIHNPRKDDIITNTVDAYVTNHTNNNNTDLIPLPALPSELIIYIKKIKIKKSPGRDGITNKMIKNLHLITVFKIINIINNMFKLRYFPNAWKTAVLIPILKPGKNPTLADSHRPISLLPILSKLAEKIISARDLMTILRRITSSLRSSTGSALVSTPPISYSE
ncbi:putative RNA-directed DNA polymerase from transposon X-element [Trichonephila clavipes]|nr:putative RNA-directed DNA polymerase from transposon X-element [Trichonephila clavipes]